MPRVGVPLFVVAILVAAAAACGSESKTAGGGALPPPGAGYGSSSAAPDELRVLSRDDCVSLRDHQIEIAVADAMNETNDPGKRMEIEARVRADNKAKTEAWVKSCSGRSVPSKLLRCWKESTTPKTYVACDLPAPAASSAAPPADAATGG